MIGFQLIMVMLLVLVFLVWIWAGMQVYDAWDADVNKDKKYKTLSPPIDAFPFMILWVIGGFILIGVGMMYAGI